MMNDANTQNSEYNKIVSETRRDQFVFNILSREICDMKPGQNNMLTISGNSDPYEKAKTIYNFFFVTNSCDCIEISYAVSMGWRFVIKGYEKNTPKERCPILLQLNWRPDNTFIAKNKELLTSLVKMLSENDKCIILYSDETTDYQEHLASDGDWSVFQCEYHSIIALSDATLVNQKNVMEEHDRRDIGPFSSSLISEISYYKYWGNHNPNEYKEYRNNYVIFLKMRELNYPKMIARNITPKTMMAAASKYPEFAAVFGDPDSFLINYLGGDLNNEQQ